MPREYTETGTIEFAGKIPKKLYIEFTGLFPQHGSITWFIRTSLETFLTQIENDPDAVTRIKETIASVVKNS